MSSVEIHMFDSSTHRQPLAAGEVLFAAGDPGDVMYAVVEGEVDVFVEGVLVETLGPGHLLGEMALIDSEPRSATATARTDCVVVPIPQREFLFLIDEHPTFALNVMRTMADRLRHRGHPSPS